MNIDQILDEDHDLPISKKLQLAFQNAAKDLLDAREGKSSEDNTTPPVEEETNIDGESNLGGEEEVIS